MELALSSHEVRLSASVIERHANLRANTQFLVPNWRRSATARGQVGSTADARSPVYVSRKARAYVYAGARSLAHARARRGRVEPRGAGIVVSTADASHGTHCQERAGFHARLRPLLKEDRETSCSRRMEEVRRPLRIHCDHDTSRSLYGLETRLQVASRRCRTACSGSVATRGHHGSRSVKAAADTHDCCPLTTSCKQRSVVATFMK